LICRIRRRRMRCAIPSPRICWRAAATCAPSRNCSAIRAFPPHRPIRPSTCPACWRSMSVRIRGSDISVIYLLGLLFLGLAGLQAVQPAWAEMSEQSCGTDLMAGLEQRDPEKYARIRAAADAVPNGRGLLWRIEREGVKVSWLFGTTHLSDGRI